MICRTVRPAIGRSGLENALELGIAYTSVFQRGLRLAYSG